MFWLLLSCAHPKSRTFQCLMLCQWEATQESGREHGQDTNLSWPKDAPSHGTPCPVHKLGEAGANHSQGMGLGGFNHWVSIWVLNTGWWQTALCMSCLFGFYGTVFLYYIVMTIINRNNYHYHYSYLLFVSIIKLFLSEPWLLFSFPIVLLNPSEKGKILSCAQCLCVVLCC